jgi:hypothetical protein
MNNRWAVLVAASLVAFTSLVVTWQFRHYEYSSPGSALQKEPYSSLAQSFLRGGRLAAITNIVDRSEEYILASGTFQYYDLVLPENACVFMTDMAGPTNWNKLMYYYYATYYLFPREIGVSIDQPTHMTPDRFPGRTTKSDQEILAHGFDVRFDIAPGARLNVKALRELRLRFPTNPAWFNSYFDTFTAFLLPLLTALAGMWLFRFLFSTLSERMPLLEQLAYGLGLGMMTVAALTLGIKLCGFHGRGLVFIVTGVGAVAEILHNRNAYVMGIVRGYWKLIRHPLAIAIVATGALMFLIMFRLSGLQGLVEIDAVMAWSLKAKVIHLYTGNELVQWFSQPRLAHAHLDYPTLVPSLHAATYDAIGHVDEFVTKFWPTWILLFLLTVLVSMNRGGSNRFYAPSLGLLGLLLLPAIQKYVQMEGGTLPMIFFTVLGFVQCAFWLVGKDRARLGLGMTLLFGAAMAKYEGFIFLALVGCWLLAVPSARPSLKLSPRLWRVLAFWLLAALPFVCLRTQIPVLHYESGWAGYALHHPGSTLSNCPWIFMILFARLFVSSDWANWGGEDGRLHWIGRWDGLSSLYNHSTLGLAWLCLLMTAVLWSAVPDRRRVIVWILAMLVGALFAFSVVFASLLNVTSLIAVTGLTADHIAGRYLLPLLLAWYATIMSLFFANLLPSTSTLAPSPTVTESPALTSTSRQSLPVLKDRFRVAVGAFLIMVLGVFVLPNATTTNPVDVSETNSPEDADVQARMELAIQMDRAGMPAEAMQACREAVRLYPTNPIALNNLAWSLAANPKQELRNGKEAVQLATKAVELTDYQQPVFIGTLAAAYAEDGLMAKAVELAEKARNLALLARQPAVALKNEQLLRRYSAGKSVDATKEP